MLVSDEVTFVTNVGGTTVFVIVPQPNMSVAVFFILPTKTTSQHLPISLFLFL